MELVDIARGVISGSNYLALGTADAAGVPWVSPVYYTPDGFHDFYWVSAPETRHSRNIAVRPEVSIAIFDSQAPIGGAEAVYLAATAAEVPPEDLPQFAAVFNARLPEQKRIAAEELQAPGLFRLYRARAVEHSVLIRGSDPRYGRGADSRMPVTIPRDSTAG